MPDFPPIGRSWSSNYEKGRSGRADFPANYPSLLQNTPPNRTIKRVIGTQPNAGSRLTHRFGLGRPISPPSNPYYLSRPKSNIGHFRPLKRQKTYFNHFLKGLHLIREVFNRVRTFIYAPAMAFSRPNGAKRQPDQEREFTPSTYHSEKANAPGIGRIELDPGFLGGQSQTHQAEAVL